MDEKYLKILNELTDDGKKIFDKLPEQRQELVAQVLEKIAGGGLTWEKGWIGGEMRNPITKINYKGINSLLLGFAADRRGYDDCRWVTFNQMTDKGWSFKKNEDGTSKGKNASVPVEYFTFYDKLTKKPLDWKKYNKLTDEEKTKYWKENVRALVRTYRVFNCSLIEGVPALEKTEEIKQELNERAERIITNSEAKVNYDGGDKAYYRPSTDDIHLPKRELFLSYEEFLGTALHEIGHSTGHSSRLNREMGGGFGSESYAKEELNAELFSMFEQQALDVKMTDGQIENHSAYLAGWKKEICNNPNSLFIAIANAQKMVTYVNEHYLDMSAATDEEQAGLAIEEELTAEAKSKDFSKPISDTDAVASDLPSNTIEISRLLDKDSLWIVKFDNGQRISGTRAELADIIKSFQKDGIGFRDYDIVVTENQPKHLQSFLQGYVNFCENTMGFVTIPEYLTYLENPNTLLAQIQRDTVYCAKFEDAEKPYEYGTLSAMDKLGETDNQLRRKLMKSKGFISTNVADVEHQPEALKQFYTAYFEYGQSNNGISRTPADFCKNVYEKNIDDMLGALSNTIEQYNELFSLEKGKQVRMDGYIPGGLDNTDIYSIYTCCCRLESAMREEHRKIASFKNEYNIESNTDNTVFLETKKTLFSEGGIKKAIVSDDVDFSKLSPELIEKYCVLWKNSGAYNSSIADKEFLKLCPEAARPLLKEDRASTEAGRELIAKINENNEYAFLDSDKLDENKVFNKLSQPTEMAMKEKAAKIAYETVYLKDREFTPIVQLNWSESGYLCKDGPEEYAYNYGNSLLDIANTVTSEKHPDEGYYKTDFAVKLKRAGEKVFEYNGRYDIGSENGDLTNHIREYAKETIADYNSGMYNSVASAEQNEERVSAHKYVLEEVVPYLEKASKWNYQPKQGLVTVEAINQKINELCSENGVALADSDEYEVLCNMRDFAFDEAYSPAMREQMQNMMAKNINEKTTVLSLKNTNLAE